MMEILPIVFIVMFLSQSIYGQIVLGGVTFEMPKAPDIFNTKCQSSVTTYTTGQHPCKNELIFEDHFDGNFLNKKKWTVEKYTPIVSGTPDYEFVSYEGNEETLFVNNSKLVINPVPANNEDQIKGELNLTNGCTSLIEDQCYYQQIGANILPPVKSAQISSKFSFTYGKIEVKAKLPIGDWLYPKIQLVPQVKTKTGAKLWVAYSRGNSYYIGPAGDVGSSILYGGLVLGGSEPTRSQYTRKRKSVTPYGEETYTYSLIWEPDKITVLLNNEPYGTYPIDETDSRFDPFATAFQLSIGIGVGGIIDFPDNYVSNNPKPWLNSDSHQLKKFFDNRNTWLPTWKEQNIQLQIDYVKIWAL